MPLISVIMSVYNGEDYIKDSIESILNQTFTDYEFIITDDFSSDNTFELLRQYNDPRIKLIKNTSNLGLTKSLNRMVDISRGEFIARMDADDVSHIHRLEKQLYFMRNNPDTGVCGSNIKEYKSDEKHKRKIYFDHEEIKAAILFENPIPHSGAMIRRSVLDEHNIRYNEKFKVIQDYELWQRLVKITRFANLYDVLLEYRKLDSSVTNRSLKRSNYREQFLKLIYQATLDDMGISASESDLSTHMFICSSNINRSHACLLEGEVWLKKLYKRNCMNNIYNQTIFKDIIGYYWFNLCTRSSSLGIFSAKKYIESELFNFKSIDINNLTKLLFKCLIKYDKKLSQS